MLVISMKMQFIRTAFFLVHLKLSMEVDRRFSNTVITVLKLAKDMNRKKSEPQSCPPVMLINTLGRVMKIRLGPASGSTLKLKQAGKMMRPETMATKVSRAQILTDSLTSVKRSDM